MTTSPIFSVLRAGMSIHGDITADHGFTCLALVTGNVSASHGLLHIGRGGVVHGNVDGDHVVIDGIVEGDVVGRTSLVINGRVKGKIFYAGTIRLGENVSLEGSSISRVQAVGYIPPQTEGSDTIHVEQDEKAGEVA
ncbi:polymer-forming cytoskeletal protein [Cupriavidus sp. U2]|uniref:bactofilin family protein n=1 Tax=Cupriavidus sp. U2 TaxID=2920269 RepID=UPI00129E4673|nr:polymer-forming cytoskeletal protein [Cupriavidus sp. U2]